VVFFALLLGLPVLLTAIQSQSLTLFEAFYRAGSLVFGGGHVVLPLLQASVVPPGVGEDDAFLAGYGAAQAVPGPLFTFTAYLGAVMGPQPNGWRGAGLVPVCRLPPFLPAGHRGASLLGRPAQTSMGAVGAGRRQRRRGRAVAVGVLSSGMERRDYRRGRFHLALMAFLLLFMWRTPPWLVVVFWPSAEQ